MHDSTAHNRVLRFLPSSLYSFSYKAFLERGGGGGRGGLAAIPLGHCGPLDGNI
jgi:hypothetical protein